MLKLTEAEGLIQRETAHVVHNRPVCVRLCASGVRVWLKGKKESYTVPYDELFRDAQRGSVKIPARKIADAKLAKIIVKRELDSATRHACGHLIFPGEERRCVVCEGGKDRLPGGAAFSGSESTGHGDA